MQVLHFEESHQLGLRCARRSAAQRPAVAAGCSPSPGTLLIVVDAFRFLVGLLSLRKDWIAVLDRRCSLLRSLQAMQRASSLAPAERDSSADALDGSVVVDLNSVLRQRIIHLATSAPLALEGWGAAEDVAMPADVEATRVAAATESAAQDFNGRRVDKRSLDADAVLEAQTVRRDWARSWERSRSASTEKTSAWAAVEGAAAVVPPCMAISGDARLVLVELRAMGGASPSPRGGADGWNWFRPSADASPLERAESSAQKLNRRLLRAFEARFWCPWLSHRPLRVVQSDGSVTSLVPRLRIHALLQHVAELEVPRAVVAVRLYGGCTLSEAVDAWLDHGFCTFLAPRQATLMLACPLAFGLDYLVSAAAESPSATCLTFSLSHTHARMAQVYELVAVLKHLSSEIEGVMFRGAELLSAALLRTPLPNTAPDTSALASFDLRAHESFLHALRQRYSKVAQLLLGVPFVGGRK